MAVSDGRFDRGRGGELLGPQELAQLALFRAGLRRQLRLRIEDAGNKRRSLRCSRSTDFAVFERKPRITQITRIKKRSGGFISTGVISRDWWFSSFLLFFTYSNIVFLFLFYYNFILKLL